MSLFADVDLDNLASPSENYQYFSIDDLNAETFDECNLSLLNYNLRSFNTNSDSFLAFLKTLNFEFDFILLSETWNTSNTVNLCTIDNYSAFHTFRQNLRGGGVSIFCKSVYEVSKIDSLSSCTEDSEFCVVKVNYFGKPLVIIGVYRPPNAAVNDFLLQLERLLQSPILDGCLVVVAGDFNIDITNDDSRQTNLFTSLMSSRSFCPYITKPTRFSPGNADVTASALDHIWINAILSGTSGIIYHDITDHCPCFVSLAYAESPQNPKTTVITFRPYDDEKFDKLKTKLLNTDWDHLITGNTIDEIYLNFINPGTTLR